MSENPGKSDTELAIESFVDRIKEIHPELDQEEFHNAISEYVQETVTGEDNDEEDSDEGS